jgi:hypothetical protein
MLSLSAPPLMFYHCRLDVIAKDDTARPQQSAIILETITFTARASHLTGPLRHPLELALVQTECSLGRLTNPCFISVTIKLLYRTSLAYSSSQDVQTEAFRTLPTTDSCGRHSFINCNAFGLFHERNHQAKPSPIRRITSWQVRSTTPL